MTSADEMNGGQPSLTVWHDGACPLCRAEIALMRRLDRRGRIAFVDLTTVEACPLDRSRMLSRLHAREADGSIVSGAAAFSALWRQIPALRPLGDLARHPRVLALLERAYVAFLAVRPRLQALARRLAAPGARPRYG